MKSEEQDEDSDKFPEMTVFSRNLNLMALSFQGSLTTIASAAFAQNLISSEMRNEATDAKAGHAKTYTSKILNEILNNIKISENPEEVLEKFIVRVVMPIGGAACKEVAKKLRKLWNMCLYFIYTFVQYR